MTEFIHTLKQTFRVGKDDLLSYGFVPTIGGIVGLIIMLVVLAVVGAEEGYIKLGTLFVLFIGAIFLLFGGVFTQPQEFNLAISMGKTRKYYVWAKYIFLVSICLLLDAITLLINKLEEILYTTFFPGIAGIFSIDGILTAPVLIGFAFIMPMIILLFGVLFMKFAGKFFWVLWVIWMVTFSMGPNMITAVKHNPDSTLGKIGAVLVDFFTQITPMQIAVTFVVCLILGMTATVLLFGKQRVTE